jgi:hypothetical protein
LGGQKGRDDPLHGNTAELQSDVWPVAGEDPLGGWLAARYRLAGYVVRWQPMQVAMPEASSPGMKSSDWAYCFFPAVRQSVDQLVLTATL